MAAADRDASIPALERLGYLKLLALSYGSDERADLAGIERLRVEYGLDQDGVVKGADLGQSRYVAELCEHRADVAAGAVQQDPAVVQHVHLFVRPSEMVAEFVDHIVGDEVFKRQALCGGPFIEQGQAVEPDHGRDLRRRGHLPTAKLRSGPQAIRRAIDRGLCGRHIEAYGREPRTHPRSHALPAQRRARPALPPGL